MKGKVYEFIDPKTGKVEEVPEENIGGFEGDFMEDVKKRFGRHRLVLTGKTKEENRELIEKFFSDHNNFE